MNKTVWFGRLAIVIGAVLLSVSIYAQEAPEMGNEQVEVQNAALVQSVYAELVNDRNVSLIDQYWDENFVQHNPTLPDGRDVLRSFVESLPPQAYLRIYRVLADGDMVVVHSQLTFTQEDRDNEFIGLALMDIFRIEEGLIVEHWDVSQTIPAESVSGNSMFDGAGKLGN